MQAMHTALHSDSSQPLTSSASSSVWLIDSGATNHMTADLSNLTFSSPYPTIDTIQKANCGGLQVSNIGHSTISTSASTMHLKFVLHVLELAQNLISVHRLCLDNNCRLISDVFYFWIEDKVTERILYKGLCSNGCTLFIPCRFQPLTSHLSSHAKALLGQHVQSSLWHHRLGHPKNQVVSLVLQQAQITVRKQSLSMMCHLCLEGKFSKLPFSSHVNKFVIPFETVHSDLWGSAPCISVDGYRYDTIFVNECTTPVIA